MSSAVGSLLVVDQGSTATKGAVYGADGAVLARSEVPTPIRHGRRIEHDPLELLASVEQVVDSLLAAAGPAAALGVTCQRSTCLLWERRSGEPMTAAVSWQDTSEAPRLTALAPSAAKIARCTGLRLSPHYAAGKLAALLEELPRGRQRAAAGELVAGTLDAFLMRRLTGRETTEPGHAGRALLYNLSEGAWDPELCELFGVPLAALPEILPSAGARGSYREIPVTGLAGDQQAALLGHGGWREGAAAVHFGTGAFVLAATGPEARWHEGLLTAVTASAGRERRFQLEGSVNSAGSAVDWAVGLTGEDLTEWTDRALDPATLPRMLPAFNGLAAPWWRPAARGAVAGLELGHGGPELLAAALCGVAHRVLDCIDALRDAGLDLTVLRASGKLTRLRGLVGLLADAGGITVEVAAAEETGLAGLAALTAAGLTGEAEELELTPETAARRAPGWSAEDAAAERAAWRELIERCSPADSTGD